MCATYLLFLIRIPLGVKTIVLVEETVGVKGMAQNKVLATSRTNLQYSISKFLLVDLH